jgi:signal transduction histidine kinase
VQEALTNADRHSGGTRAVVRIAPTEGCLALEVRDNGSGSVLPRPDGVGLESMRTRAEEIGGTFELRARVGAGTTIDVRLPFVELRTAGTA